jgi:DNA-binding CsgD family transcriptional regulator
VKRAATETILGSVIEKPLLQLHAAPRLEPFWRAVQRVIEAVLPGSLIGLTLQHHPISPLTAKWSRSILDGSFDAKPITTYLIEHPRSRRFVRASEVFPKRGTMLRSDFYRKYMAPQKRLHAIGLFFWQRQRLLAIIVIMRTAKQGDFTSVQTKLLRHLYPQFETALRRLQLLERERAARTALEGFLSRLPLPTMLLRWNLRLVYQNKAAREFCNLWAVGPELASVTKANQPVPAEILDRCRRLKKRWRRTSQWTIPRMILRQEVIHHSKWSFLRATLNMRQLSMGSLARPHFLIECEELRRPATPLPHLVRLTQREQQLSRLVCDGHSNQEIADRAGLSVAMVKKHLHSIFHKLEVPSRSRLIALMR